MRRMIAAVMVLFVMGTTGVLAQDVSRTAAGVSSVDVRTPRPRLVLSMPDSPAVDLVTFRRATGFKVQQPASQAPNWIARHPTLFGAMVGAGGGAASSAVGVGELYCASGGDEDCFFHGAGGVLFGTALGAGVGALIGFLAGR